MNGIRSGFRNDVHDRTRIPAIFGVESIGKYAKLLDGVRRRLNGGRVHEQIVPIATVDHVVVGSSATAVYRNDARIRAAIKQISSYLGLHARLQLQQLVSVAGIERKFANRSIGHDATQLGAGGLNLHRVGFDGDRVG